VDFVSIRLAQIREVLEEILPETFKIMDIVYRDMDMGVQGSAGYSFYLMKADESGGAGTVLTTVNETRIKEAAFHLMEQLEGKKS